MRSRDIVRNFGQDLARQRQPRSGIVLTEASTMSGSNGRRLTPVPGRRFSPRSVNKTQSHRQPISPSSKCLHRCGFGE